MVLTMGFGRLLWSKFCLCCCSNELLGQDEVMNYAKLQVQLELKSIQDERKGYVGANQWFQIVTSLEKSTISIENFNYCH